MEPEALPHLQELINLVGNVFNAHTAALFLAEEGQDYLELGPVHSLSRRIRPQVRIPFGAGVVGWVAKEGKPMNLAPFNCNSQALQYYKREEPIKAFMAAPVIWGQQVRGVLVVDSKGSYCYTPKDQKVLQGFADYIAQPLEQIRIRCQMEKSGHPAALLTYTSFWESVERLSGAKHCPQPASVLALKIKNLPAINQEHGTRVGDEVLRQLGSILKQVIGEEAILGRLGGKTLAVALQNGKPGKTEELQERLSEIMLHLDLWVGKTAIKPQVAIGVVTPPR